MEIRTGGLGDKLEEGDQRWDATEQASHRGLCGLLERSKMFKVYRKSFRQATGVSLVLIEEDAIGAGRCAAGENQPDFSIVDQDVRGMDQPCVWVAIALKRPASGSPCGSRQKYPAVPVYFGPTVIGYLVLAIPEGTEGEPEGSIGDPGRDCSVGVERLRGAIALATYFSEQLSRLMAKLDLVDSGAEPIGIVKAREFIGENITKPLPLSLVAERAALSESYFCRLFKEHTGVTLTEYVTRLRISKAKRELLRAGLRITEIAFMVGFQSLSQFNRSFVRIVGCSPSQFRARKLEEYEKLIA